MENVGESVEISTEKNMAGFSTRLVEKKRLILWKTLGKRWKSAGGVRDLFGSVDVGDDSLDRFSEIVVVFHTVLDFGDAVEGRGVVPLEELAGFIQGEAGHAADEVHGDLAGVEDFPAAGGNKPRPSPGSGST